MPELINLVANHQLTFTDWVWAFTAAVLLGLGKAGIKGIGIITVTLLALVFGGKPSTGILIPMMVFADIMAVIYYRRHTQLFYLKKLLPTMVIGVLLGVWLGNDISDAGFKQLMAILILLIVVVMFYLEFKKFKEIPNHWLFSTSMGLFSGFTSMVGNLAGSFSNIYFLAMRLPKNEFLGTAALLFFIINVFKLPFHIFVWKTVTPESLVFNLTLVPAIILGFIVGVNIVKLINTNSYRKFVLGITAIGALVILFR